jgi:hypothetical protein
LPQAFLSKLSIGGGSLKLSLFFDPSFDFFSLEWYKIVFRSLLFCFPGAVSKDGNLVADEADCNRRAELGCFEKQSLELDIFCTIFGQSGDSSLNFEINERVFSIFIFLGLSDFEIYNFWSYNL